jgi:hypothetical protein
MIDEEKKVARHQMKIDVDLSDLAAKLRAAADALDGPPPTAAVDLDQLTEAAELRMDDDVLALIAEVRRRRGR